MSRAARSVAKEMAQALELGATWARSVWVPMVGGKAHEDRPEYIEDARKTASMRIAYIPIRRESLQRWLLALAPPIKRRSVSKATKTRRATKRDLDSLCREITFERDGQKCRRCQRTDRQLQWCHVYPKGAHPWLRHDMDNVFVGCAHCHMNWWHAKPEEAMRWWEEQIGAKAMAALRLRAARPSKTTAIAVKAYLEAEKRRLS